jgi:hypothetical protein
MTSFIGDITTVVINSSNRTTGSNSSFTHRVNLPDKNNYDRVVVIRALVPKSYYSIGLNRSSFTLIEDGVSTVITLTPANYSYTSFKAEIVLKINAASPNNWTYACSYPNIQNQPNTGKFTYTVSGNSSQPSFDFSTHSNSGVHNAMGFDTDEAPVFDAGVLVSTNVINLSSEASLYIRSNICENHDNQILQDVFQNNVSFGYIEFESNDVLLNSRKIKRNQDNSYWFMLTNEENEEMLLNGQNILISLCFFKLDRSSHNTQTMARFDHAEKIKAV